MDKKSLKACMSVRRKTRWAMDFDYLSRLTEAELRYLAEFCNLHYHGSPHRAGEFIAVTPEMRRESYRRNNKAEIDLYNHSIKVQLVVVTVEPDFDVENYLIDFIDNKYI